MHLPECESVEGARTRGLETHPGNGQVWSEPLEQSDRSTSLESLLLALQFESIIPSGYDEEVTRYGVYEVTDHAILSTL